MIKFVLLAFFIICSFTISYSQCNPTSFGGGTSACVNQSKTFWVVNGTDCSVGWATDIGNFTISGGSFTLTWASAGQKVINVGNISTVVNVRNLSQPDAGIIINDNVDVNVGDPLSDIRVTGYNGEILKWQKKLLTQTWGEAVDIYAGSTLEASNLSNTEAYDYRVVVFNSCYNPQVYDYAYTQIFPQSLIAIRYNGQYVTKQEIQMNTSFTLEANHSLSNPTYSWFEPGNLQSIGSGQTVTLTTPKAGFYSVVVLSNGVEHEARVDIIPFDTQNVTACKDNSIQLTAPSGKISYSWLDDQGNILKWSNNNTYTVNRVVSNTVVAAQYFDSDGNACKRYFNITATINANTPLIPSFNKVGQNYDLISANNDTQDFTYWWFENLTPINGINSVSINTNEYGQIYYLRSKDVNNCYSEYVAIRVPTDEKTKTILPQFDANSNNHIKTVTYKKAVSAIQDYTVLNPSEADIDTKYFDGIGRPYQTVKKAFSPLLNDYFEYYDYDPLNRTEKQFLPAILNANNGQISLNPIGDINLFYSSTSAVASTSKPFSYSLFDDSPLNLQIEHANPGESWSFGTDHSRTIQYGGLTDPNEFKYYILSNNEIVEYVVDLTAIFKEEMYNEDDQLTISYKNRYGILVLKRTYLPEENEWVDTHYLYDEYNNLSVVIPPEASKRISEYTSGTISEKESFISTWCFRYSYDGRNRMISKKVPGASELLMVYDDRDRLRFTQDGEQRLASQWMFTTYDALNRPVATGLINTQKTRSELQAMLDNTAVSEVVDLQSEHGYTFSSLPSELNSAEAHFLTFSYYDKYDYLISLNNNLEYEGLSWQVNTPQGISDFPTDATLLKDQLVGAKTRVLTNDWLTNPIWITTVNYYDPKSRLVQTVFQNDYLQSFTRISNLYNFPGWLVSTRETKQKMGEPLREIRRRYSYDHQGRLLTGYHEILVNQQSLGEVLLAQNKYNALGELIEKNLHVENGVSLQSVDYRYNIRGWLQSINNTSLNEDQMMNPDDPVGDYFGMQLFYNDIIPGF